MLIPRGMPCLAWRLSGQRLFCPVMAAPAVERTSSQVVATLADRVVHYEVTETFANFGPRLAEADYVFPLPAGAAFQDLQLSINGQLVAGEALNATEARGVYEEIVRRLRDPALVEWMGDGMLRARIFPIAPNEVKKVVVRFQTVAQREGDAIRVDYAGARPTRSPCRPIATRSAETTALASVAAPPTFFTLSPTTPADEFGTAYSPTHTLAYGTRRRSPDDPHRRRRARHYDPAARQPQLGGGRDDASVCGGRRTGFRTHHGRHPLRCTSCRRRGISPSCSTSRAR